MSFTTLCLLAALCPQGPGRGGLVLPRPKPAAEVQAAQPAELLPAEQFHRVAMRLRRSARLSRNTEELILAGIGGDFQDPAALALAQARKAKPDLMHGLLRVLGRYGSGQAVAELEFLLLTRPFGGATREGVKTLALLSGDRAKDVLLNCFTSRYSGVRKAATDLLLARIDQSDTARLLELSRAEKTDVRRKALFLLGALPSPEAQQRLMEVLSDRDATLAATACRSLVDHGPEVAPLLTPVVARPATGRPFGYCAFALTQLEDRTGKVFLTEDMVPHLRAELIGSDVFLRATVALALANLAFRSGETSGARYGDPEIVDGLMLVVAPRGYVSNISMLQQSASQKLVQFTGADWRGRNEAWHSWWRATRSGFVGTRLGIEVTAENAAGAVLTWSTPRRTLRIYGEFAPVPVADADKFDAGADADPDPDADRVDAYRLSGGEFAALVARLREHGFMTQGLLATAVAEILPPGRTLDLVLGGSRCRISGPAARARWMDVLASDIDAVVERERWQLYPDPAAQSTAAFWRAEREQMAALGSRVAADRRLKARILAAYPDLSPWRRTRAVRHLLALPDLGALLTAADGTRLVTQIEAAQELDAEMFQLAEVALMVPGETTWRRVLSAVESHFETGGEAALPRLFALLGADRVRQVAAAASPRMRVAAVLEVANLGDLAAVPVLTAALEEPERALREAAIYALGVLRATETRAALRALEVGPQTEASTRRVIWVALARIGGAGVFEILQSAVAAPALEDQLAAIQALGELQEPRCAHMLAQIFVGNGFNPRGTRAMASLQKLGPLLARPALRLHLSVRDQRVRREIVQLLADFQDPAVIPDLIALLKIEPERARTSVLLAGITGVDLTAENDRAEVMKDWWRTHRDLPQASWFLECLEENRIQTTIVVADLAPKTGHQAVEELTRIMLGTDRPHVRVLAAALLRQTTARDFGLISMNTTATRLQAIADRYRFYADAERASRR